MAACRIPFGRHNDKLVSRVMLSPDYEYLVWLRTEIYNQPDHKHRWLLPYLDAATELARRITVAKGFCCNHGKCRDHPQWIVVVGSLCEGLNISLAGLRCDFHKPSLGMRQISRSEWEYTLPLGFHVFCEKPLAERYARKGDREQYFKEVLRPVLALPARITDQTAWQFLAPLYQAILSDARRMEEVANVVATPALPAVIPRPSTPPIVAPDGQCLLGI